jgi:hypothetical protein
MRKIGPWLFVSLAILLGAGSTIAAAADDWDGDVLGGDFDEGQGSDAMSSDTTDSPWELSVAGGRTIVHKMDAHMTTHAVDVTLIQDSRLLQLIFPSRGVTIDKPSDGWAAHLTVSRSLLSWVRLGVQFDASFSHGQQVESGDIAYIQFGSNGEIVTQGSVKYSIDYRSNLYGATPVLQLGRYIPVGNFALKPYVTAGFGAKYLYERLTLSAADADFELGERRTTVASTILGGGLDLRFSKSGSVGLQYQHHRTTGSDHDWSVSQITLSTAYLF